MKVRYSRHLILRLKMRGIPENLPKKIYLRAKRRFFDKETKLEIATNKAKLFGKMREVMVAYRRFNGDILLITIHPLKRGQLQNRIDYGRWQEL